MAKKKPAITSPPEYVFRKRPIAMSGRELDVLRLYAAGRTYGQAAEELGIASTTVGTYMQNVREKLRARTRSDIIAHATRERLMK